jgi:hypothetical protein
MIQPRNFFPESVPDRFFIYKVILCCLVAPIFYANLHNLIVLTFDAAIGFKPVKITYFGVLGCMPDAWMYLAAFITFVPVGFTINMVGYTLSQKKQTAYKLIGAVLLFGVVFRMAEELLHIVVGGAHPLSFIRNKENYMLEVFPVFGNKYYFFWVRFVVEKSLLLFYFYLCYRVVKYYWDKRMRVYFLPMEPLPAHCQFMCGTLHWDRFYTI